MEDLSDIAFTGLFEYPEDAVILKQLSAFYSFKKKGIEVVTKVYPDMVEFVLENHRMSYEEVRSGLLVKWQ